MRSTLLKWVGPALAALAAFSPAFDAAATATEGRVSFENRSPDAVTLTVTNVRLGDGAVYTGPLTYAVEPGQSFGLGWTDKSPLWASALEYQVSSPSGTWNYVASDPWETTLRFVRPAHGVVLGNASTSPVVVLCDSFLDANGSEIDCSQLAWRVEASSTFAPTLSGAPLTASQLQYTELVLGGVSGKWSPGDLGYTLLKEQVAERLGADKGVVTKTSEFLMRLQPAFERALLWRP